MKVSDLKESEFNPFYSGYISKVSTERTLEAGFKLGGDDLVQFFKSIPKDKLEYRYAEGKWTVKEVLQHIIDTERVLAYRCFRIARHDKTALAGFDQNDYVVPSKANQKTLESIIEEYQAVRLSSVALINSLDQEDLSFVGNANGDNMSARAAAFIILGHEIWHMDIIKSRYL